MVNETCKVIEHRELGSGYRFISFDAPQIAAAATPGQFVHVRVPGLEASALRRPFSIFNAEDGRLELLYKTVGRGTAALNAVKVGDAVSVMGPLGHGFPTKCTGEALLVGGGFGVAPLYFLARRLLAANPNTQTPANPNNPNTQQPNNPITAIRLFVGGRTKDDLLALDRFEALGGVDVHLATNDGSAGAKGLVTDPLDDELIRLRGEGGKFELFACGPDPMLKAVAMRATGTGAKGWISMDRHMVCGVGACYACIQKTVRGNSRCCIEGPVFAASDLVW